MKKNEEAVKEHSAACDALNSELQKIAGDFCKSGATEGDKGTVYNDLLKVFIHSIGDLDKRVKQLGEFDTNFPKDLKNESSEQILEIVKTVEEKFKNDYVDLTNMKNVTVSFTDVYNTELSKLDFVVDIDNVKPALENANKMFKNIGDTYMNVANAFKAYYELKLAIFKKIGEDKAGGKKEGPSNSTIILIVVIVLGGLIVIGLIFCFFYFKKETNRINNESLPEQDKI